MVWVSPCKAFDEYTPNQQKAVWNFWFYGDLTFKLDPVQLQVYRKIKHFFKEAPNQFKRKFLLEWSRRFGKDWLLLVFNLEMIAQNIDHTYIYATSTQKSLVEILLPLLTEIELDCPPELRLIPQRALGSFIHPVTGSRLRMVGIDKNPEALRGTGNDGFTLTECGYIEHMEACEAVIRPQLRTKPHSYRLYNSTPPPSIGHPWIATMVPEAKAGGYYDLKILDEDPKSDEATIEAAYVESGGRDSEESQREYRCVHLTDPERAIVKEWPKVKDICCVDEYERPEFVHCYEVMDPGQVDLHGFVYFYYDMPHDMMVFEKSYSLRSPKTSEIAESMKETEFELWNNEVKVYYWDEHDFQKNPYRRITDTDLRLVNDLSNDYGLDIYGTRKDDLVSAVNQFRDRVHRCKVRILPGASSLKDQLAAGIWPVDKDGNVIKKKFAYVSKVYGHFDELACAIYGHRNLDTVSNPNPPVYVSQQGKVGWFSKPKPSNRLPGVKRDGLGGIKG